ncbi:MAG: NADH-quinone oxidoreductase subunit J [Epsilonproteobacteria bacterium]|nr:NADH-quinone oxidoreductase subunit J [Campylobacterota bacterium]
MSVLILALAIILAVMSLTQKNTVPSVLAFVLMMFLLGIYYILMDEKLLGLFQIFVYTGGIVVLTLFGVTVIGAKFPKFEIRPWAVSIVTVVIIGLLIVPFILPDMPTTQKAIPLKDQVKIFTDFYSEIAIFMGVVAASVLYGSIRMLHTLKHGKE